MIPRFVVAVRAALPSPRPQGWQATQMALGLADAGARRVDLVGDAALVDGVPATVEGWVGRSLPDRLVLHRPDRSARPPTAGLRFRVALRGVSGRDAVLLCRDPRVAAEARWLGRWAAVILEWHVQPDPSSSRHRRGLRAADLHVAVAPGLRDDLLALGISPGKVLLLPNACGLSRDRALARSRRGAPVEPRVVALGLHRRGGMDVALAAWREDPGLPPLLIAGRDQGGARIESWRAVVEADPRLRGRVSLVGPRWGDDRDALLDEASVVLALYPDDESTRTRLCPLQVADALGSGVPLVTTDLPGIRAQAASARAAWVLPEAPPSGLAQAVRGAIEGPWTTPAEVAARPRWADRARVLSTSLDAPAGAVA